MTPRRIFLLIIIGIIGFGLLTGPRHQQMLVQCHDSPGVPFLEVLVSKSGFKESTSSLAICNRFGSTTNRAPTIPKTTKHSYTQASESSVQGLKDNFVAHAPITIQNNTDFLTQASNEGWSGTGIATDPIIITGYSITSLTSILLEISYTTLHFEVRNNVFNGVNRTYDAIHLKNVKNGVIANNTVYYSKNAIYFFADTRMTYTTIANNTIESNQVGIYLYSADIDLFGNKLIDNLEAGIFLGWVFASSIKDNVLVNNGLDATYIHDSQVSNNSVNGKPLVYWQNINGGTIPNGAGQVVLVNCNTVTVSNQVLTNASVGIIAFSCSNLNISSNILANNSKYGILAGGSTSSTVITNNTFLNNKYAGIRVADGKGTIENNILRNNGFGIRMHSPRFFIISNNSLINNHVGICSSKAYIGDDGFLDITTNIIANNSWGIYLTNPYLYISMEFTIRNNTIANNTVNGIKLSNSNSNLIWGNTLIENTQYGIILDRASAGNRILWNTFINNHGNGSSQAYDGGNTNTFSYNYWSEWVSPD
ncbi:MAG: right-handed parallel beta-helix repeat-containing protein, partial [Promethearchaeota archaeon]